MPHKAVLYQCFEPAYAGGFPQAAFSVHSEEALRPQSNVGFPYFECWLKTYRYASHNVGQS